MTDYVRGLRAAIGHAPLITPGSSVVVLDGSGRILLMRRGDTGDWGLPGGLMEPGESLEQTARREVFEEVGLRLGELTLLGVFSGPELHYIYPNGDEIHNVTAAWTARLPARARPRVDGQEAVCARFFAPSALPADVLAPERPILARFAAAYDESRMRGQQ